MIIIGQRTGQLGNRLLLFAHFIANAIEYGGEVWNPSFYDYAGYFESTHADFLCRFPARPGRVVRMAFLQRLFYLGIRAVVSLGRVLPPNQMVNVLGIPGDSAKDEFDLAQPGFQKLYNDSKILIVHGWPYRDHTAFWKHRRAVRDYFHLLPSHQKSTDALLSKARENTDVLIGVHIRQGDYKYWRQGEYFFQTQAYAQFMLACLNLFPRKTIKFLICSNVPQDEQYFSNFNYIFGTNHLAEDMYALAGCDYLIGPPSTFTAWASYYGEVPLCRIRSTEMEISQQSFSVYGYRSG